MEMETGSLTAAKKEVLRLKMPTSLATVSVFIDL